MPISSPGPVLTGLVAVLLCAAAPAQPPAAVPPPPGYPPVPGMAGPLAGDTGAPRRGQFREQQSDTAYTLDIATGAGLTPAQIEVEVVGPALVVRIAQSGQTRREVTSGDGRGFVRTYQWHRGARSRRLPVPPDGDLAAMTRTDGPDGVHITIPRRGQPRPNTPVPQVPQ